jgi:DNA polymerase I-like protein with 3'-5' exonuclease and polymerase domains
VIVRSYAQKEVMVISDFPLVNESKRSVPYSEPSQTNLKDALSNASFQACEDIDNKFLLNNLTICYTYLSTERYYEGDFDWKSSVVSKKNIPEGFTYHQIPWLKDVWVTPGIWEQLQETITQIQQVQPRIIICAGKWALMFLATLPMDTTKQIGTIASTKGKVSDKKMFGALNTYRSSILTLKPELEVTKQTIVYPILTPAYLFLVKDRQFAVNRDYAKIARIHRVLSEGTDINTYLSPDLQLEIATFETGMTYLQELHTKLEQGPTLVAMDIETRHGYTDCIGIAYETNRSMTIPFSYKEKIVNEITGRKGYITKKKIETYRDIELGETITDYKHYFPLEEEVTICDLLFKVMLHPNCQHVGQNYNYDAQYYFHHWLLRIYAHYDTMIQHHVLYNYMQKNLAFLASIYCDWYVYWKDELNNTENEVRWQYNGKDCIYTLIIAEVLVQILAIQPTKLQQFYKFQQYEVSPTIVNMMNRGCLIDVTKKEELRIQFTDIMEDCLSKINYVFGEEINLNSTPQVKRALKDLLGIKPLLNPKTKRETFGSDAMLCYLDDYPEWRTILTLFLEYKSIKVFVKNFLSAEVDSDGRMRCDYNVAGTKTYRLSSRKNVFGRATNLANIPSKGKIDLRVALQELNVDEEGDTTLVFDTDTGNEYEGILKLPNVKEIFLPDEDYIFFNADYGGADAMVVAMDSNCKWLLDFFETSDEKLYIVIASEYLQERITTDDPRYKKYKAFIHLTNYGGRVKKAAITAGIPINEAKKLQEFYFSLCPEIPRWHQRIQNDIKKRGYIENCFGARFWFPDLTKPTWTNQAYATIPQSTIAVLCNKGLVNLEKTVIAAKNNILQPGIESQLQTHDAVSGQFHKKFLSTAPKVIVDSMTMPLDYPGISLQIPVELELSDKSYGDVKRYYFEDK